MVKYYSEVKKLMNHFLKDGYEFLQDSIGSANFLFSTAKGNLNFNINETEGRNNIKNLKKWFNVNDVGFLRQIHSDIVYEYDGSIHEGDAIVTDKRNIAIGVFTADCVPVLIYDKAKNVAAAVHSGWKGTLSGIIMNTLTKMKQDYGCKSEDLIAYIGPHNKSCCYEIGEDVKKLFENSDHYKNIEIINDNKLNLEKCIIEQLLLSKVHKENINAVGICTFCNKDLMLHSYRKSKENCGRMFSFIYLN